MKFIWKFTKYSVLLIFLFLIVVLFPLKNLIFSGIIFQKNLILLVNDYETRPCGGFITAYGIWDLKKGKTPLHNVYTLDEFTFGKAENPLKQVNQEVKFWDLTQSANMYECSENILTKFKEIKPHTGAKNIILVNISGVESILQNFESFKIGEQEIPSNQIFSYLSKSTADVDRHKESALDNRKNIAVGFKGPIKNKLLSNPQLWPTISQQINNKINQGQFYIPQISPNIEPNSKDFWIEEWNLGGGKSSRFLNKKITIKAKENKPQQWDITTTFSAEHFGQFNQPISQTWKGNLSLHFPEFLNEKTHEITLKIPTGKSWSKTFQHKYTGDLYLEEFTIFKHNGLQNLDTQINLSLLPQKTITTKNLTTKDNWGHLNTTMTTTRTPIHWTETSDITDPFITLHEPLNLSIFPEELQQKLKDKNLFFIELHFNEIIKSTDQFKATLIDTNHTNQETNKLTLKYHEVLKDQHSMILGFSQTTDFQQDERYELNIENIVDLAQNSINSNAPRTIITKVNPNTKIKSPDIKKQ